MIESAQEAERIGAFGDAERLLEAALQLDSNDDYVWTALGYVRFRQERFTASIAAFNRAVTINGANASAHFGIGKAYRDSGSLDKALNHFEKCVELSPTAPRLIVLGDIQAKLRMRSDAERSFKLAKTKGSAIAAVRLKESIRVVHKNSSKSVDRSSYRLIQTPQTFQYGLIEHAYQLKETDDITDDATVAERYGIEIHLFEGDLENIKITTPEDILIAEAILEYRKLRNAENRN